MAEQRLVRDVPIPNVHPDWPKGIQWNAKQFYIWCPSCHREVGVNFALYPTPIADNYENATFHGAILKKSNTLPRQPKSTVFLLCPYNDCKTKLQVVPTLFVPDDPRDQPSDEYDDDENGDDENDDSGDNDDDGNENGDDGKQTRRSSIVSPPSNDKEKKRRLEPDGSYPHGRL